MMNDLISRDAAVKVLCERCDARCSACKDIECEDIRALKSVPAIGANPAVRGWISVKDRLPETYKCCLCYTDSRRIMEATLDEDGNWYDEGLDECYVTHWMQLPEPPEEDSEC